MTKKITASGKKKKKLEFFSSQKLSLKNFPEKSSGKTFRKKLSGKNFPEKNFQKKLSGKNFPEKTFRKKLSGLTFQHFFLDFFFNLAKNCKKHFQKLS